MTIRFEKIHLFFALLAILGALYAVNIFSINKITSLLVDKPAKLSFVVVAPEKEKCEKCFDAQKVIDIIKVSHNTKISIKKTLNPKSSDYLNIIKKYDIKNLPALLVSGDIDDERILGAWKSFDGKKVDGRIVIQNLIPFYDIEEKRTKGLVDVILLKDSKCVDCFDEGGYLNMLERRGMVVKNSRTYDVSSKEGSSLVSKYSITKIPTMILSSGASDYADFIKSWKDVGTKENDGWFVLREVQRIANGLTFKKI